MFCENCGNEIKGEAKFCSKCGNPINIYKSVPNLSQKYNRNISNNWFAKIDNDVIKKYATGFQELFCFLFYLYFTVRLEICDLKLQISLSQFYIYPFLQENLHFLKFLLE